MPDLPELSTPAASSQAEDDEVELRAVGKVDKLILNKFVMTSLVTHLLSSSTAPTLRSMDSSEVHIVEVEPFLVTSTR